VLDGLAIVHAAGGQARTSAPNAHVREPAFVEETLEDVDVE